MAPHEIRTEGRLLATVEPATREEVLTMIMALPRTNDGRSAWGWMRLPNGDLFFGCFPQGDTYELITQTMIRGRV